MATREQTLVVRALEKLGFTMIPDESGKVGGPTEMTISGEAADALKEHTFRVNGDATITHKVG